MYMIYVNNKTLPIDTISLYQYIYNHTCTILCLYSIWLLLWTVVYYVYIYIYTYIYIYIHIHTHTHLLIYLISIKWTGSFRGMHLFHGSRSNHWTSPVPPEGSGLPPSSSASALRSRAWPGVGPFWLRRSLAAAGPSWGSPLRDVKVARRSWRFGRFGYFGILKLVETQLKIGGYAHIHPYPILLGQLSRVPNLTRNAHCPLATDVKGVGANKNANL